MLNLSSLVDKLIYLVERNIKHAELKDFSQSSTMKNLNSSSVMSRSEDCIIEN